MVTLCPDVHTSACQLLLTAPQLWSSQRIRCCARALSTGNSAGQTRRSSAQHRPLGQVPPQLGHWPRPSLEPSSYMGLLHQLSWLAGRPDPGARCHPALRLGMSRLAQRLG